MLNKESVINVPQAPPGVGQAVAPVMLVLILYDQVKEVLSTVPATRVTLVLAPGKIVSVVVVALPLATG